MRTQRLPLPTPESWRPFRPEAEFGDPRGPDATGAMIRFLDEGAPCGDA